MGNNDPLTLEKLKIDERLRAVEVKLENISASYLAEVGDGTGTKGILWPRINAVHEDVKEIKSLIKIQNGRVSKLEQSRDFFRGVVVAIGAASTATGVIIGWVMQIWKH